MSSALVNDRTQSALATRLEFAVTRAARRRGLLGRHGLAPMSALILSPCFAIHTAFMRFPIDVVFMGRDFRAVGVARNLRPWRLAVSLRARAVIELPAGTLGDEDVHVGDHLSFVPQARLAAHTAFDIRPAC